MLTTIEPAIRGLLGGIAVPGGVLIVLRALVQAGISQYATPVPAGAIERLTLEGAVSGVQESPNSSRDVGTALIPPSMRVGFPGDRGTQLRLGPAAKRGCPKCIEESSTGLAMPLAWRASTSLSCPRHAVHLETADALWWCKVTPTAAPPRNRPPSEASPAESKHDTRLTLAFRGESIQTRVGLMKASMWLAGLRQLEIELSLAGLVLQLPASSRRQLGLAASDRRYALDVTLGA